MLTYTNEQMWAFWNKVMVNLSTGAGLYEPIPGALAEFCEFFRFGCGFIYMSDYEGDFYLKEKYASYDEQKMHSRLNLRSLLGDEFFMSLSHKKQVFVNNETSKSKLEERLCMIFDATSLLFAPIVDQNMTLMSFICIIDRRGQSRLDISHFNFAFSILYTISNNIKLVLYKRGISRTQESLKSILDNMPIGLCINDTNTRDVLYTNKQMTEKYLNKEEFLSRLRFESSLKNSSDESKKWEMQSSDGSWYKVISVPLKWTDGRMVHITSLVDITGDKNQEKLIQLLADSDDLTRLPNRRKLEKDFDKLIKSGASCYLIFLDLNNFKEINDTMGHKTGDELLISIAERLTDSPITSGYAYRHGGDEFALICKGFERDMLVMVEFLLNIFDESWTIGNRQVFSGASIGISSFPTDGETYDELFGCADRAMYAAKTTLRTSAVMYNNGRLQDFEVYRRVLVD
ncbi:MAG: GGDEF domain-containing protein [Defluviitaleaceae bacterium]|nr:GGDEF domain-containing protein [Defluviitaleaceae bacterium]